MAVADYLDVYNYEYILAQALAQVPNTLDKREGSVIFDAIAPACYELAMIYMQLKQVVEQTFVSSASGQYLDLRAQEQGITRYGATYAVKKAVFLNVTGSPIIVAVGSRFSTIADAQSVNYAVSAQYLDEDGIAVAGTYELTCEVLGTIGNAYTGALIPISYIAGLATATMSDIIIPAQDNETDEEFLARYLAKVNQKAFGGNIAQYDEMLKGMNGVGEAQIYPVWDGGGTVKLSVIDAEYNPITTDFIHELQVEIDPENTVGDTGTGLGRAPIGHKVTVTTPTQLLANISATLTLKSGYTIPMVESAVTTSLAAYMLELRKEWGVPDELNNHTLAVYVARITSAILSVAGIANVTDVEINGSSADVVLTQNATTQQLPMLGTVTLNE